MKLLSSVALALGVAVAGVGLHGVAVAGPKDQIHAKALEQAKVSLLDVVAMAQKDHSLKVLSAELDLEQSQARYEIKGVNAQNQEVEIDFNAVDGKVLTQKVDGAAEQKDLTRLSGAKVSLQDAVQAALKAESGSVVDVELDEHKGVLNYEVLVFTGGHGHKVRVNAQDGTVMAGKHNHKH